MGIHGRGRFGCYNNGKSGQFKTSLLRLYAVHYYTHFKFYKERLLMRRMYGKVEDGPCFGLLKCKKVDETSHSTS
jgi:hypothetical protein